MSIGKILTNNINSNSKKIAAIIGDIILTIFTVLLIAFKSDLDITTTIILLAVAVRPFITTSLNIIFKGEANAILNQNEILKGQIETQQEIHEYRCRLAASLGEVPVAIASTKAWLTLNDKLNLMNQPKVAEKPKVVPAVIPKI